MMSRRSGDQPSFIYQFRLDERVPKDHLLRRIDRFVTPALADMHERLQPYYSEIGRPSIDPELIIRMLIVGYCYGLRSERRRRRRRYKPPIGGPVRQLRDSGLFPSTSDLRPRFWAMLHHQPIARAVNSSFIPLSALRTAENMNLEGETVLVTGSTDGVGRLVARRLADQGAYVLVHGRDRHRGEQALERIQASGRGSAVFLPADFSSLAEVRRLAEAVRQNCDRLDILINNAGIGSGGPGAKRETSQDGYELRFAVNYLCGFLLTRLLLPIMTLSKPARIVNVSSLGQHPIDFDDVMLTHGYTGGRAYTQSKLAQIMFTFDLARELDPDTITANCLHPATYMATTMVRQSGVTPISTVEEGAEAILNLAISKELEGHSGEFYSGLSPSRANAQAYDSSARERLRVLSARLTGLAS